MYSIGVAVTGAGLVTVVQWDSAAFKAGLAPGATLVAVNSRRFGATLLREAITDAVRTHEPVELLAKADDRFRTVSLRYDQGLRYPHLERLPDRPDLLSKMLAPRGSESAGCGHRVTPGVRPAGDAEDPCRPGAVGRERQLPGGLPPASKNAVPERIAVTDGAERAYDDGSGEQAHRAP